MRRNLLASLFRSFRPANADLRAASSIDRKRLQDFVVVNSPTIEAAPSRKPVLAGGTSSLSAFDKALSELCRPRGRRTLPYLDSGYRAGAARR